MFNDKYGLTKAVLEGRKTMTRRVVPEKLLEAYYDYDDYVNAVAPRDIPCSREYEEEFFLRRSRYNVGEVVAVAQAYCDIQEFNPESYEDVMLDDGAICEAGHPHSNLMMTEGWHNKMFVRAHLMPYRIRITNVRVERLQDISDEDCLREGIYAHTVQLDETPGVKPYTSYSYNMLPGSNIKRWWFGTPRKAFAALIDKLNGKGTWTSNPWVFVYEYERVK